MLLSPVIGSTLPVFVVDRYEGFDDVRSFTDLSDDELEAYLRRTSPPCAAPMSGMRASSC